MYFEVLKNLIHILAFIWILKQSICVFNCASNCYYNSGKYCTPSSIFFYSDECNNYCKPKYFGSSKQCVYCYPKATSYYTIEENGNCLVDQCIGNKIIDHTLECTDRDISLYKLEDFYYSNPPSDASCQNKICSCLSYYVVDKVVYGKKKITCYDLINNRPSNTNIKYYNYNTKELLPDCPLGFKYMKKKTILNYPDIIRCSDSCLDSEWNLPIPDENNPNINNEYCVDNCRDENHYPGISSNYQYEYIDNGIRKCLKACPAGTYKKYIKRNSDGMIIQSLCATINECDFYVKNALSEIECYSTCNDYNSQYYHNYLSKECIPSCTRDDYLYADISLKICYRKENCNFIDEIQSPKRCLSSCESPNLYHNYGSISCIPSCSGNKPYHTAGGYICFSSCSEIPDDYKFEEKDNTICHISKRGLDCPAYYRKVDGIFKCISISDCINNKNYPYLLGDECRPNCDGYYKIEIIDFISSLKYNKCFESLDSTLVYSVPNINDNNHEVKYCDLSQKKCWTSFPNDGQYYINKQLRSTTSSKQYELVRECSHFYYEDSDPFQSNIKRYWCIDNCKNTNGYKYFLRGNKQCINSCKDIHIYYYDDENNECLESCELRPGKQFSYPIISDTPTKCFSYCINSNDYTGKYYNFDSHICLARCNSNNNNYLYHKFTNNENDPELYRCYPSCLDIIDRYEGIGEPTVYKYTDSEGNCYENKPDNNCNFYFSLSDGVKKCAELAECKALNYFYLYNNECIPKCEDNFYTMEKTYPVGLESVTFWKCYPSPNDCLIGEINDGNVISKIFYNKELKECYSTYKNEYYIKVFNEETYELVQICENFYFLNFLPDQSGLDGYKYCTDNCLTSSITSRKLFFENNNKECKYSCTDFGKYYYDPTNNECLDTCEGRDNMEYALPILSNHPEPCIAKCPSSHPYFIEKTIQNDHFTIIKRYECVNSCPYYTLDNHNYFLLDIQTNECKEAEKCPETKYFIVDNICYPKCDVSNNYKYINSDTYKCVQACPSELKSMVRLGNTDIFLCKSLCDGTNKFRYGDECVEKCPRTHKFIGYNNICKETCAEDANGQFYYPINAKDNPAPDFIIYKCISSCSFAKIVFNGQEFSYSFYEKNNPNECLDNCPNSSPYYILSSPSECISSCPEDLPFYNSELLSPNIKCEADNICRTNNRNNYFLGGQCVTLDYCLNRGKEYVDSRKICLDKCPDTNVIKKIEYSQSSYKCLRNCEINEFIIYNDINQKQECISNCPYNKNFIGKDNICKSSCDENDGIYYYKVNTLQKPNSDNTYNIYKCVDGCKEENTENSNERGYKYKLANNGNECFRDCPYDFPYLSRDENLCYDDCLNSDKNPFTFKEQKLCVNSCEQNNQYRFWGENKVCLDSCNQLSDTKLIDYNNKCVEKCNFEAYHFQLDGYCVYSCYTPAINQNKKRYSTEDYICREKCREDEFIKDENICSKKCDDSDFILPLSTGERKCVSFCPDDKKYFYENQKICLAECNEGDKIAEGTNNCVSSCEILSNEKNEKYFLYETDFPTFEDSFSRYDKCVLNCPSQKPYINQDKCVKYCPTNLNKFFVESDVNQYKNCLYDCPKDYPYFIIEEDPDDPNNASKKKYICQATCNGYYVPNVEDPSIIAKQCLNNCPDSIYNTYRYKIVNETDNTKKCYIECPLEAKYHFLEGSTVDNNCYEKCPEEKAAPYHIRGETICKKITEFRGGFILYDIKEYLDSITTCPEDYPYKSITEDGNDITICLKECNFQYYDTAQNKYILYGYLTPYKTCVSDCEHSPTVFGKHLKNDEQTKTCICKKKYYIDSNSQIQCYPETIENCKDTINPNHPLPLYKTDQCLNICNNDRILTPSEDECYEKDTPCSDIVSYSYTKLITKENGLKKCECSYKFYFHQNKKVCLAENSVCPSEKNLLIPKTLECIDSCPNQYPYQFKNYCLDLCPLHSHANIMNICVCNGFWYELYPQNYECLEGFCLEGYPVYVELTKECLKTCKGSPYKYLFNNKCYNNCNFIPNIEEMELDSTLADYKCDCKRPWYYDIDNNNIMHCPPDDNSIKKCRDYTDKNLPFMVNITRQCVEKCPNEYPYYFNHKCYKSCEEANEEYKYNIETVENSYECRCQNLWKIDPEDLYHTDKICYDKNINECPPYPNDNSIVYQIFETKQCVENKNKCPSTSFKFNMICYEKCPEFTLEIKKNTLENNLDNTCTCNREKDRIDSYLYLEYEKYGNTYYKCGLNSCPDKFIVDGKEYVRNILLENEKKCVKSCLEDGADTNVYLYSFRNKCVIECPTLTKTINDECIFYDVNNITTINSLDKLKEAANIQAKELYEKSETLSGYLLNKFDSSLQIYAVDKLNNYKDLSMKSNLTYIDLGTCLNKIYSDKNLNDNDKILIVKYDLLNRMTKNDNNNNNDDNIVEISKENKFLINQVEYEFYLQNNMEKIEGSICSPYEIEISYPIFFNKNKFNNFETGFNENNYLKLFKIGKILNDKDPEADTFNKENKIYKDICYGVELDGKDIVFEDRYKILYPNNISLCESNCTMSYTDFILERINCMCTYKEIFDFYRIDEETNDILHDPNFILPSQSKANVEIIKCIKTLKFKKDLLKNEAFYFSSVITVVEIITAVISAIQGVKIVSSFTQGMFNMNGAKIIFQGNKSNLVSLSSTNRLMNNPPKKDNNGKDKEEIDEENKKNVVVIKNVLNNNQPIKIISKNFENDLINSNSNLDYNNDIYDPNIEQSFPKNKKRINLIDENDFKMKLNSLNSKSYNTNIAQEKIAEFIPPKYNFKFFKPTDKGIIKQIPRSKIPFKIGKYTKYLVEYKKDVVYNKNYLKGPFYEDQNIIEIISDNGSNSNQILKSNNDELIEHSDGSNVILTKNMKTVFRNNDLFKKENYYNSKKKTVSYNINKLPQNYIKIRKINPFKNLKQNNPIDEYEYKKEDELSKFDNITSIYTLMKREHTYLRMSYEFYISKKHPGILPTLLAEIFDKIYLVKTLILLKKFEITSIYISLYMFYHILLVSLLCGFFTINTIKRIWADNDFPTLSFYLLYGFIANVIDWVIYKIFILLLDNQDRIRALVKLGDDFTNTKSINLITKENEEGINNEVVNTNIQVQQRIEEKYDELMKKIRLQMTLFYIVNFFLTGFLFMYLISFFAVYTGTKKLIIKAYYISIIEITIIKFVYGLSLGSLRIAAEINKFKNLYNFVYICDKYLS